jgi:HNH endonuclease
LVKYIKVRLKKINSEEENEQRQNENDFSGLLFFHSFTCNINFEDIYGILGKEFIEAHHLRPIAQLTGDRVQLDVRTDFTVLCSNCHSMIHGLDDPSNLKLLKSILKTRIN